MRDIFLFGVFMDPCSKGQAPSWPNFWFFWPCTCEQKAQGVQRQDESDAVVPAYVANVEEPLPPQHDLLVIEEACDDEDPSLQEQDMPTNVPDDASDASVEIVSLLSEFGNDSSLDPEVEESIDPGQDGSDCFGSEGLVHTLEIPSEDALAICQQNRPVFNKRMSTDEFIQSGIGNFRKSMLWIPAPTATEMGRGVHIEELYDFYDPVSSEVRSRRMTDTVMHKRRASMLAEPEPQWRRSSSPASSSRSSTGSLHPIQGRLKKSSNWNLEHVATWGAIVGSLLHRQGALGTVTERAIRHAGHRNAKLRLQLVDQSISSSLHEKAGAVISRARRLAKQLKTEDDQRDCEWLRPDIMSHLFTSQHVDLLLLFARAAAKLIASQPTVAVALAPCYVYGDIHGQLRDLLLLFACFGMPDSSGETSFVFNGDFVDRGSHQIEVIGLLLALKIWMPGKIWLIRGNHEDRTMNERYGFKDACYKAFGPQFGPMWFDSVHKAFDVLPLACLIEQRVLVVHGGIGDGSWTLDDLRTLKRPLRVGDAADNTKTLSYDILWSDPIEDGKFGDSSVFGVHESPRGKLGSQFSWNITKTFCARNGISLIIRSHQSKKGSPGFDVMHENLLVRVFSARDYEDHGNDAAILRIVKDVDAGNKELLKIRPHVLRSVTKARSEAGRRQKESPEKQQTGAKRDSGRLRKSSKEMVQIKYGTPKTANSFSFG